MLKRSLLITLSLIGLSGSVWALQAPGAVYAEDPQGEICKGIGAVSGSGNDCSSDVSLTEIVRNVINIFSIIIGIVAVIMIMVGGFRYITAAGDSSRLSGARNTIVFAIVGLVVAALAQVIVRFVLSNVD